MSEKAQKILDAVQAYDSYDGTDWGGLEAEIDRILGSEPVETPVKGCPRCSAPLVPLGNGAYTDYEACSYCGLGKRPKVAETPAKGPTDEELANLKANMAYFSPENEENRRFSSVKEAETKLSLVELKEDRRLPFLSREISTKYIEQSF